MIFSGSIEDGPDGVVHQKFVFNKEYTFDAKSIGELTGNNLESRDLDGQEYFGGKSQSHWGGLQGTPCIAILAVERKARRVLKSLSDDTKLARMVAAQPRTVDASIVVVSNEHSSAVAADLFDYHESTKLSDSIESGVLNFDFDADRFLYGKVALTSVDAAIAIHGQVDELVKNSIKETRELAEGFRESISTKDRKDPENHMVRIARQYELYADVLEQLQFERDENSLTVTATLVGGNRKVADELIRTIFNDLLR